MATTDRQNRLLVAEDWKKIYQSFQQADFKSYDFETLRRTMVAYLRENDPDDFNDFVESLKSEDYYATRQNMVAIVSQGLETILKLETDSVMAHFEEEDLCPGCFANDISDMNRAQNICEAFNRYLGDADARDCE